MSMITDHIFNLIFYTDIIPSPISAKSNIYNKIASPTPSVIGFPIIFHHLDESITLFTENESTRKLWLDKINELDN